MEKIVKLNSWKYAYGSGNCGLTYAKVFEAIVEIGLEKVDECWLTASRNQIARMISQGASGQTDSLIAMSLFYQKKIIYNDNLDRSKIFIGDKNEYSIIIEYCYVTCGDNTVYIECLM